MSAETPYRIALATILLANLAVSATFRRRARATEPIERREETLSLVLGRLVLVLPTLAVLGTYLLAPDRIAWAHLELPAWLRVAGGALALLTVPANVWILRTIGPNISETVLTKPSHQLVERGPYGWIRHPLYTSGLAMCLAFSMLAANWLMLGLTAAAAAFIATAVVPREELELERRFGERYRRYKRLTGAFLPRR